MRTYQFVLLTASADVRWCIEFFQRQTVRLPYALIKNNNSTSVGNFREVDRFSLQKNVAIKNWINLQRTVKSCSFPLRIIVRVCENLQQ